MWVNTTSCALIPCNVGPEKKVLDDCEYISLFIQNQETVKAKSMMVTQAVKAAVRVVNSGLKVARQTDYLAILRTRLPLQRQNQIGRGQEVTNRVKGHRYDGGIKLRTMVLAQYTHQHSKGTQVWQGFKLRRMVWAQYTQTQPGIWHGYLSYTLVFHAYVFNTCMLIC